MTYSIIARCPRTGRFGVGSTTFSMACGRRNESVRPNVGISKSQAFYLRYVRISITANSASSTARTMSLRTPVRDAASGPAIR